MGLIIFLIICGIYGISIVLGILLLTRKYHPHSCELCKRDVVPGKKFNWIAFIFLLGFIYLIYYLFKKPQCPICGNESFNDLKVDHRTQKKAIIVIIILLGIVIISAFGVYMYVFHKPHRNVANEKPAFTMTAVELIKQFSAKEDSCYKAYGDKAMQISGKIADLTKKGDIVQTIILEDTNAGINCGFDSTYSAENKDKVAKLKIGDEITLKGKCDGYDAIMGVVLTRCSIVEKKQ
jgi:hypothetical protein